MNPCTVVKILHRGSSFNWVAAAQADYLRVETHSTRLPTTFQLSESDPSKAKTSQTGAWRRGLEPGSGV